MMNPAPMMPYPGAFGMPSQMPTQPVMPTQPSMYNPYAPQPVPPIKSAEFDWIRVNSMDDVKNVSVPPGQKAWIMLQNDPIFVVKSANDMGLATTQAFKFEPYNPQQPAAAPATEYTPMSFVQRLQQQIEALSNELNTLKGGMTRGKPVKQSASAE